MFPHISNEQDSSFLKSRTILLTLAGSMSYGTNQEGSDTDYRGVLTLPIDHYLSPKKTLEQIAWAEEDIDEEGTVYELRKFVSLAAQCNPNIIESMFCRPDHVVYINKAGELLKENRDLFLTQRAHKSFLGYARSQLKRIKTHKAWIDSPPAKQPLREDFGLPEFRPVSVDQMNAARAFVMKHTEAMVPWLLEADNLHKEAFWEGVIWIVAATLDNFDKKFESWVEIEDFSQEIVASSMGFNEGFVELLKKEKGYLQAAAHWKQYQSWKKNRNRKRAELESKYGFDCKHAMHLVRLMRMGEEVLQTGRVQVYRENDREELLDIRNGKWPYGKLVEWADNKTVEINELVRSGKSTLPKEPDSVAIEELTIELIKIND